MDPLYTPFVGGDDKLPFTLFIPWQQGT